MFYNSLIKRQLLLLLPLLIPSVPTEAGNKPQVYYPQSRIVGGATASEGQFPHQVSLKFLNNHNCGGSILTSTYIVTAAHCVMLGKPPVKIPAQLLSIRAGSRDVDEGGQFVRVSEVKVHPLYDGQDYDIAVLKLARPLQLNDKVKTIALAKRDPPTGVPILTSGWGMTKNGGNTTKYLQYNTLMALRREDCSRVMYRVHESILCLAHANNNGVCKGDSGGPATYKNTLVGVTNYISGGCGSYNPDGFASVAYFREWLRNNTNLP
ncbi:serine protease SP24D-like [Musca autumnalis]|uniref:serine protease SP24D-like n=1 Tax=Musca autumnalis TaxID=221902 RepID=UPI003CF3378B